MAASSVSRSVKVRWARCLAFRSPQTISMSFNSGAYLGSHSTVSQWARSANAARLALLTWSGPLSKDEDDGLGRCAGFWTVAASERVQVLDEVGASLGPGRRDDQITPGLVERPDHGDLLGLPRRRNPQVGPAPGPGAREIGVGERFTLVGEQQLDVAGLGLRAKQFDPEPAAIDRLGVLAALQRVAGSAIAKAPFLRSALESCDFEIVTPSRAAISSARRASVQLTRFVTGADNRGSATRKAACVFTGA